MNGCLLDFVLRAVPDRQRLVAPAPQPPCSRIMRAGRFSPIRASLPSARVASLRKHNGRIGVASSFSEAISRAPLKSFSIVTFAVCMLVLTCDGMDAQLLGILAPDVVADFVVDRHVPPARRLVGG